MDTSFVSGLSIFLTCICLSCIVSDSDAKLTWGSMYLGYNEAGNNLIVGFQGRYLIPIAVSLNLYTLFYVLQEVTW